VARSDARNRTSIGLTIAAGVAALLGWLLLYWAADAARQGAAERAARQRAAAFASIVERAGPAGNRIRAAVAAMDAGDPTVERARVVLLEGRQLVASTSPEDAGVRAAPRALEMPEKPIYDLARELRAAVETNREEGAARKDEIHRVHLPSGGISVAAPLQRGEDVVGMVQLEMAPQVHARGPALLQSLGAWLLPPALFLLLSIPLRGRPLPLLVTAAVLLVIAVVAQTGLAASHLGWDSRRTIEQSAGQLRDLGERASRALADLPAAEASPEVAPEPPGETTAPLPEQSPASTGPAEESASLPELPSFDTALGGPPEEAASPQVPLDPVAWDVDRFRRPLSLLSGDGTPAPDALSAAQAQAVRFGRRAAGLIVVLSLALFLFVALGTAEAATGAVMQHRVAYLYVLPAMLGMTLLVFFPFLYGITLSFTDANLYNSNQSIAETWSGLANYAEVLSGLNLVRHTDSGWSFDYGSFYWTLFFTIVWTITNVTIGVSVGLVLALVLNTKGLALRPVYRVLLVLPWAVPTYITALTWRGMFHQQFGVINQVIQMFGGPALSWYDKPFTSYLTALATNGWLSFPFMMVVSLGALQSIPAELYEAARVDGASRWHQFRAITLPSLKPALVPAVILSVVWTFNQFNVIYLVTAGEPGGSTEILITKAYKIAFEKYRYGYAAAYSTVIFAILLAYGVLQNRMSRATEDIA
jgi:arabinogalactan oligomer/maltooligosaccharide transport system permease protein